MGDRERASRILKCVADSSIITKHSRHDVHSNFMPQIPKSEPESCDYSTRGLVLQTEGSRLVSQVRTYYHGVSAASLMEV